MKYATQVILTSFSALPLLVGSATGAMAATMDPVIYNNGVPNANSLGIVSEAGLVPPFVVADDFLLAPGQNVVTDYHWYGAYTTSAVGQEPTDKFSVLIFEGTASSPTNLISVPLQFASVDRIATGNNLSSGQAIYEYSVKPTTPVSLTPNTPYWLAIYNETPSGEWVWAQSAQSGNAVFSTSTTLSSWSSLASAGLPSEMAFNLTGVPEPLTIGGVVLAGSFGAAFKRKLNQSRKQEEDKS